ncbi:MAG: hypothetical protein Q7K29_02290 [Thermoleophilia bacterium]|nr:hypothetical protein [Thermoleophilia bacterium]
MKQIGVLNIDFTVSYEDFIEEGLIKEPSFLRLGSHVAHPATGSDGNGPVKDAS